MDKQEIEQLLQEANAPALRGDGRGLARIQSILVNAIPGYEGKTPLPGGPLITKINELDHVFVDHYKAVRHGESHVSNGELAEQIYNIMHS